MNQIFVSNSGSDASSGVLASPVQTIARAVALAKSLDMITLRAGVYRETIAIPNGVTLNAVDGEIATISGADVITGWASEGGGIFKAQLPWTLGSGSDQVFVDGQMIPEARWPVPGMDISRPAKSSIGSIVNVSQTSVTFTDPNLSQPDGTWVGASVHLIPGAQWITVTGKVTAHVGKQLTVAYTLTDTGPFAQTYEWATKGNAYYLYGIKAAMTSPGQWFRDSSGVLHLWLADGSDPNKHVIEVKRRKYAFEQSKTNGVKISGVNLFAATIQSGGTTDLLIDRINAKYLSHFSGAFGWGAPTDSGIVLNGTGCTLQNSSIQYSAGDGVMLGGSGCAASNNSVLDCNYDAADGAGINILWGTRHVVTQNEVGRTGRDGIKLSNAPGVAALATITHNHIHDVMLQTADGGGIYTVKTNGAGSLIANNRIHGGHDTGFGTAGVYLDNNCSGFTVQGNLCYDLDHAAKHNHDGLGHTIAKNTLIGTQHAIDADVLSNFAGTSYSNNILIGSARFGTGTKQSGNVTQATFVNPAAGDYHASLVGVGAYADGDWNAGPVAVVPSPTPPVIPSVPVQAVPTMDAFTPRCATAADGKFGDVAAATSGNLSALAYCNPGNWVLYKAVDFKTVATKFIAQVGGDPTVNGKQIELRLDSPAGPLIGTLTMQSTGGWWTFAGLSCPVTGAAGVHDLYLVFKGQGTCNLAAFVFSQ